MFSDVFLKNCHRIWEQNRSSWPNVLIQLWANHNEGHFGLVIDDERLAGWRTHSYHTCAHCNEHSTLVIYSIYSNETAAGDGQTVVLPPDILWILIILNANGRVYIQSSEDEMALSRLPNGRLQKIMEIHALG